MSSNRQPDLSRRERQIMDVVYRRGQATAAEVQAEMPDPPSYSSVRALMRVLENKGHLRHQQEGAAYVYLPMVPADSARRSAVRHLLQTFFGGSTEKAMAALLETSQAKLSPAELDRIGHLIEAAKKEGR
jgi:BlaI family transcriptional regulator, penicillinase repressor